MHKTYETANALEKAVGKARQHIASAFARTPLRLPENLRAVSFCFDDFPASAENGGKALEDAGARGIFYACFGLLGQEGPAGKLASSEQVCRLAERGHIIGCHTFDHINCSFESAAGALASCEENRRAAEANRLIINHFSYPQGGMSLAAKRGIKRHYRTARGGFPGINHTDCDAYALKSAPLYEISLPKIYKLLNDVDIYGGWLILYTHDVCDTPSEHGISTGKFTQMVADCVRRNLPIRTVDEVASAGSV